jgi:N-acetylglucosaminyldiphosphoundecaprenol N-acetyl-beta-D-mannosaminyltransferase
MFYSVACTWLKSGLQAAAWMWRSPVRPLANYGVRSMRTVQSERAVIMSEDLKSVPSAEWYFNRRVYCFLGLPIDILQLEEVMQVVRQVKEQAGRLILLTPNTNDVVHAQADKAFRDAFLTSDISLPDGMPVVWLGRFLGLPIPERLAGADLFECIQQGHAGEMTVFLYGGQEGVGALACKAINDRKTALRCIGWMSPGFGTLDDLSKSEYLDRVNQASPDLLVLSLGKQGKPWILRNSRRINSRIISHLGAVINFAAGTVRRAPKTLQKLGLEWAWRVAQEPKLIQRYVLDAWALMALIAGRMIPLKISLKMAGRSRKSAKLQVVPGFEGFIFQLSGTWTESFLNPLRDALATASQHEAAMIFDLSLVDYIDPAVVGTLILAYGWQLRCERRFQICAASKTVKRLLRLHCCGYLFEST